MRSMVSLGLVLLVACGPKIDVMDDGDATDDADADGATSHADDGRPDPTANDDGASPSCADDPSRGCAAYCAWIAMCFGDVDVDRCVAECTMELRDPDPRCALAQCELYSCIGSTTCDSRGEACEPLEAPIDEACSDAGGECAVGIGPDGLCFSVCDGRSLSCTPEGCTCSIDGRRVATCEVTDPCEDLGALDSLAAECCGR